MIKGCDQGAGAVYIALCGEVAFGRDGLWSVVEGGSSLCHAIKSIVRHFAGPKIKTA